MLHKEATEFIIEHIFITIANNPVQHDQKNLWRDRDRVYFFVKEKLEWSNSCLFNQRFMTFLKQWHEICLSIKTNEIYVQEG